MIILNIGASYTWKTALAQKLLKKYHFSYLSIDHLKMGLFHSHQTIFTVASNDKDSIDYLWPIVF